MSSDIQHDPGYERRKAEFKRQYIKRKRRKRLLHNSIVIAIWMMLIAIVLIVGIKIIDGFFPTLSESQKSQEVNKSQAKTEVTMIPEQTPEATPSASEESLTALVNKSNPVSKGYVPELAQYDRTIIVDKRVADDLKGMVSAATNDGCSIFVASGYRTGDRQQTLYKAKADVDEAGYSEHEIGLAVDIASEEHPDTDEGFAKTKEYTWITKHCAEYGFIIRYPKDKKALTGHSFEPWHLRYVGKEAAKEIMEQGITLEEYSNKDAR